ncbi:hypothetical protein ABIE45_000271 [Methylobacterium sp. OAE515]|uniref:hypothetical protein n=1 Tax=Methylobacterium sp. OAE515 TaxID=2817895 RepID=UPI00178BA910
MASTAQVAGEKFKYGAGPMFMLAGPILVVGMLFAYNDMTSGRVEWHLWSTHLPVIIPTAIMIGLWWAGLVLFASAALIGFLPAAKLILTEEELTVQSPVTRSFRTIAYRDIRHIDQEQQAFSVHDRQGKKVRIVQAFLSKRDYNRVMEVVRSRALNAL